MRPEAAEGEQEGRQELREAHAVADAVCDRYANEIAEDVAVYYSLTAVSFATAEDADFASSCCWHAHQAIYREAEDRSGPEV